jgi:hypothetical protein
MPGAVPGLSITKLLWEYRLTVDPPSDISGFEKRLDFFQKSDKFRLHPKIGQGSGDIIIRRWNAGDEK